MSKLETLMFFFLAIVSAALTVLVGWISGIDLTERSIELSQLISDATVIGLFVGFMAWVMWT
jgi:hypothetical protein